MSAWEGGQTVALRNERKACHFWVDNEVADCYQPIVGADAVWVYCRIARYAHGAWIVSPKERGGDSRVSLREMAEWCGKSVDTVARSLEVLALVGLIRAEKAMKSRGRYALIDVKDLVTREGGIYDRECGCFRLPESRVAELVNQVRELRLRLSRKPESGSKSVAQSDRFEPVDFFVLTAGSDRSVARSDTSVALDVQPSNTKELKNARITTPPTPSLGEGDAATEKPDDAGETEGGTTSVARKVGGGIDAKRHDAHSQFSPVPGVVEAAELRKDASQASVGAQGLSRGQKKVGPPDAARAAVRTLHGANPKARVDSQSAGSVERAIDTVMLQCCFTSRRLRGILRPVIEREIDKGIHPNTTALAMSASWKAYESAKPRLRWTYGGPKRFFEEGAWRDRDGWPWEKPDKAELEMRRLYASQGMTS